METRILHTRFWKDSYINTLDHKGKLLFLYLFTNETVNICGIYELADRYICNDLEITDKELQDYKTKFQTDNKFLFHNGWIKIINVDKYNRYSGDKNDIARQNQLKRVPRELVSDTSMDTTHNQNHNHNQIQNTEGYRKARELIGRLKRP